MLSLSNYSRSQNEAAVGETSIPGEKEVPVERNAEDVQR